LCGSPGSLSLTCVTHRMLKHPVTRTQVYTLVMLVNRTCSKPLTTIL